jgi:hypothetical protein
MDIRMSAFVSSVVLNLLVVCLFFAAGMLLVVGMLGLH